jgi:hypothetical protein
MEATKKKITHVIDIYRGWIKSYFFIFPTLVYRSKGGLFTKKRIQDIAYFSRGIYWHGILDEPKKPSAGTILQQCSILLTVLMICKLRNSCFAGEQDLLAIKGIKQRRCTFQNCSMHKKQLIQSEKYGFSWRL